MQCTVCTYHCMYVRTCVRVYIYISVCVSVWVCACFSAFEYICMCVYIYVCYIYIYMYIIYMYIIYILYILYYIYYNIYIYIYYTQTHFISISACVQIIPPGDWNGTHPLHQFSLHLARWTTYDPVVVHLTSPGCAELPGLVAKNGLLWLIVLG